MLFWCSQLAALAAAQSFTDCLGELRAGRHCTVAAGVYALEHPAELADLQPGLVLDAEPGTVLWAADKVYVYGLF